MGKGNGEDAGKRVVILSCNHNKTKQVCNMGGFLFWFPFPAGLASRQPAPIKGREGAMVSFSRPHSLASAPLYENALTIRCFHDIIKQEKAC